MTKTEKPILKVIQGQKAGRIPLWLMRQAGRYLPEYRELRAKAGNFLELCLTPKLAAEITLQPIRRFGFDAAIIFADILLVPHALGQDVEFIEKKGPQLAKIKDEKSLARLKYAPEKLAPVEETLTRVKKELPAEVTLIGFCGGPWTVAAYMIDGSSAGGFAEARKWAQEKPQALDLLINILVEASAAYLCNQIAAGAEAIQIFESWAGLLEDAAFERFIIGPTAELIKRVKRKYPAIPVIGFPREAGKRYRAYAEKSGVDVLGLDQHVPLAAAAELKKLKTLQGNLDPQLLIKGGEEMRRAAEDILKTLGPVHIFNLGHGVEQITPLENVAALVKIVRDWKI